MSGQSKVLHLVEELEDDLNDVLALIEGDASAGPGDPAADGLLDLLARNLEQGARLHEAIDRMNQNITAVRTEKWAAFLSKVASDLLGARAVATGG